LIDPNCSQALQNLGGILIRGGSGVAAPVRANGAALAPESAQNVSAGFDFAPDDKFLKGLDLQATYYFLKIRNIVNFCNVGVSSGQMDNPIYTSCFVTANNNPNFNSQVLALLSNPKSSFASTQTASNIAFIADGAYQNFQWLSTNGVDFSASYTYDAGDLGAWNTGITGNYIIDNYSVLTATSPVVSVYSTPSSGTTNSGGRLHYRARLGWAGGANDAWSIVGFMNFIPHSNSNGGSLPPLCFLQGNPSCASFGPQFAQYTQQYPMLSNYIPGIYTFDLSIGYKSGDLPANRFLKNIGITLTVTDLLDTKPPFSYSIATTANVPHAFAPSVTANSAGISPNQRYFTLFVTKAW
jgi:hypothetical protein